MKNKLTKILIILMFLTIIFILKILINKIEENKQKQIETKSISYIINNKIGKPNLKDDIIKYELVLEIPKIKLKKGILKKEDKDNNIDKNVTILQESRYPNEEGNIYIAAHSGNGSKSFFNDLVKLSINDQVYLYHKEIKYTYKVDEIKEINKISFASLLTNSKNNLILITCSQTNKSKYLIIILTKTKETELSN